MPRVVTPHNVTFASGRDRILTTVIKESTSSQVIKEIVIEPSMSPRLAMHARTYNRIKYESVQFVVTPQCSTMTAGGYIAAIITDPSDTIPSGEDGGIYLITNAGAKTSNYWSKSEFSLKGKAKSRWYFTDKPESGDLRFYAPGKFVFYADTQNNQAVPLAIDMIWKVQLSDPTMTATETAYANRIISRATNFQFKPFSTGDQTKSLQYVSLWEFDQPSKTYKEIDATSFKAYANLYFLRLPGTADRTVDIPVWNGSDYHAPVSVPYTHIGIIDYGNDNRFAAATITPAGNIAVIRDSMYPVEPGYKIGQWATTENDQYFSRLTSMITVKEMDCVVVDAYDQPVTNTEVNAIIDYITRMSVTTTSNANPVSLNSTGVLQSRSME